ncbi:hypothetical protein TNCV_4501461 [Trichonephila clavipes]|nr:hypothetical protein TNCV_4501461 [Trichonephila clavipes]
MDVNKCRVPLQRGDTLHSRRAVSPLMRLVKGEKSTIQVIERFGSVSPQLWGKTPWRWSGAFYLSSYSTNLLRGFADQRLFRVPPSCKCTIHLQKSLPSSPFEQVPTAQQLVSLTAIVARRQESQEMSTGIRVTVNPQSRIELKFIRRNDDVGLAC